VNLFNARSVFYFPMEVHVPVSVWCTGLTSKLRCFFNPTVIHSYLPLDYYIFDLRAILDIVLNADCFAFHPKQWVG
jgi:hypothetical protein